VQNTWGTDWGMDGYMYFKRGTDVGGIESIASSADPYIIRRNSYGKLSKVLSDSES